MSLSQNELYPVIKSLAQALLKAQYAVILTGAGYSTPSGIPDFRSAGSGLWTKYLPMEVASLSTFRHNPELFFAWLHPLASHMLSAQPNEAHIALARLEQAGYLKAVITQNIDGLHHRAGSKNVYEIHGTFNSLTCVGCFHSFQAPEVIDNYLRNSTIPRCTLCGNILKPDIILFEEQLPYTTWRRAEKACETCDLLLVAGTSLEVMPSAKLPLTALTAGAKVALINQTETYIDERADYVLRGDVSEIMPSLAEEVLHG